MRAIILVYGEDDLEGLRKAVLQYNTIIILHVIDQDVFSTVDQLTFTTLVKKAEDNAEKLKSDLEIKGKLVRVDSVWGPIKEKLKNAMRLWEAKNAFVTKSDSPVGKAIQEKLGRMRGVKFI